jgi:hypothetical protein
MLYSVHFNVNWWLTMQLKCESTMCNSITHWKEALEKPLSPNKTATCPTCQAHCVHAWKGPYPAHSIVFQHFNFNFHLPFMDKRKWWANILKTNKEKKKCHNDICIAHSNYQHDNQLQCGKKLDWTTKIKIPLYIKFFKTTYICNLALENSPNFW